MLTAVRFGISLHAARRGVGHRCSLVASVAAPSASMKALSKAMKAFGDATQEQRARVQEVLQATLQDGALEVSVTVCVAVG